MNRLLGRIILLACIMLMSACSSSLFSSNSSNLYTRLKANIYRVNQSLTGKKKRYIKKQAVPQKVIMKGQKSTGIIKVTDSAKVALKRRPKSTLQKMIIRDKAGHKRYKGKVVSVEKQGRVKLVQKRKKHSWWQHRYQDFLRRDTKQIRAYYPRKKTRYPHKMKTTFGKGLVIKETAEPIIKRHFHIDYFDNVVLNGPFDVELIAGNDQGDLRVIGSRTLARHIKVALVKRTLYIETPTNTEFRGKATVILRSGQVQGITYKGQGNFNALGLDTKHLNLSLNTNGSANILGNDVGIHQLRLNGKGNVKISGLKSAELNIVAKGDNHVELRGEVNLRHVNFSGNGHIYLYWVKSPYLRVTGHGSTQVKLGGRVDLLTLQLYNKAYFNGRYLRTKKVFVKTYGESRADLQTTHDQYALAHDKSNVYYYNPPKYHADFMSNSGSVLNMDS